MADTIFKLLLVVLPAVFYKLGYDEGVWRSQRR
jgi:hypothetical protein